MRRPRMNIRAKARLSAIAGLAVIAVIAVSIWWAYAEVKNATLQRRQATEIARAFADFKLLTFEYVLHPNAPAREQAAAVSERLDSLIASYSCVMPSETEILARLRASRARAKSSFAQLVSSSMAGLAATPDDGLKLNLAGQLNGELLTIQKNNFNDASLLSELATQRTARAQRRVLIVTLAGLGLIAAIMGGASWFIQRKVLGPVARLQQATREVAAGNLGFRLGMDGIDEVGDLARNFDVMTGQLQVSDSALRSLVAANKEVTEALQVAVRDLARSNSELAQFAYVASHDLQEPLRMVTAYIQLLEKRLAGKLDTEAREFMGFAVDGAQRMQKLIEAILAYSRVGSRGQPLESVDSAAAFNEALALLAAPIGETHAEVSAEALPMVSADRVQLVQLFQNLVGNALKYCTAPVPQVRVAAQRDGEFWRFTVSDNGIGIEPQYYERIFGIFQRLHTRREFPGTGIGLAICKCIVERHGGEIGVEAAGVGGGSVFWFTLPEEKPHDVN